MFLNVCPANKNCGFLTKCIEGICVHNPIFPVSIYTTFVYITCPILIGIGMVGGLGGGVLKGPVFIMLLNYEVKYATFISYCIMFGGCIINGALVMRRKNPFESQRPLVNYDVALIFNCSLALGAVLGSTLNVFLPLLYSDIIQEVFLIFLIPILVKQGLKKRKEQNQIHTKLIEEKYKLDYQESVCRLTSNLPIALQQEYLQQYPLKRLAIIGGLFLLSQSIIGGGRLIAKFVEMPRCVDVNYFILPVLILINIAVTKIIYQFGQRQDALKDEFEFLPGERFFRKREFFFIYFSGLTAGLISGLIGLGAGLIMVPVMLELGLHPQIASGTSGLNYVVIALTNMITLLENNLLPWEEILFFTGLAMLGGAVISKIGYYYVQKYKMAFCVVMIVVMLAVLNLLAGIYFPIMQANRFGVESLLAFGNHC